MADAFDKVYGTPEADAMFFPGQQSYDDTCAIRCQEFIIELYTGQDLPEDLLIQQAAENGWYAPGNGTYPEHTGNLLDLYGIETTRYPQATIYELADELAQGHKVIIGVDSGELWNGMTGGEWLNDLLGLDGADHAVVVSGIDTSDPNNVQVIISDPGTGEAVAYYPMDQFLDAWADSNFFMVATNEPAPVHLPEMQHFDYFSGHLPDVAGLPYDQFITYAPQPDAFTVYIQEQAEAGYTDYAGYTDFLEEPVEDMLTIDVESIDTNLEALEENLHQVRRELNTLEDEVEGTNHVDGVTNSLDQLEGHVAQAQQAIQDLEREVADVKEGLDEHYFDQELVEIVTYDIGALSDGLEHIESNLEELQEYSHQLRGDLASGLDTGGVESHQAVIDAIQGQVNQDIRLIRDDLQQVEASLELDQALIEANHFIDTQLGLF